MKRAILLVLVLCLSLCACAQTAPPLAAVSPAKAAKIRDLLRLTGVVDVALEMMTNQMATIKKMLPLPPKAQDDFVTEFIAAIDRDKFVDLMVPIYDKHFNDSDLDQLIAFYRSPVGVKIVKELPLISKEAQVVGREWGSELGRTVGIRIGQRVDAGEYGPWPPPEGHAPQPADSGRDHDFKPAAPAPK